MRSALGELPPGLRCIAGYVADRLARFNGIDAELLPHPPQTLAYRTAPSEGFLLSVNRLDRAKRIDLLLEAAEGP